jgi:hypothetical protein
MQELLERGGIQHVVVHWNRAVNRELELLLLADLLGLVLHKIHAISTLWTCTDKLSTCLWRVPQVSATAFKSLFFLQ